MEYESLLSHAESVNEPKVFGFCRILRVCPDPVTDEWFNVGVYFEDTDGNRHFRVLKNLNAVKCIFSPSAVGNLNYLLTVIRDAASIGEIDALGAHVKAGPERYAAGDSVDEILSEAFDTFITLDRWRQDPLAIRERVEGLSTTDLRKKVFGNIRSHYPGLLGKWFHDKPIQLTDSLNQKQREYDLPIFRQPEIGSGVTKFGSIISAYVKTDMNRGFHLDRGALTLLNARDVLRQSGQAHGALFILRPFEGAPGFDEEVMQKIDNDIDTAIFHFRHDKNFEFEVFDDPFALSVHAVRYITDYGVANPS